MKWMKAHVNFLFKLLCLAIILIALMVYQNVAAGWAEEKEANEAEIAEVEAYNAAILASQEEESGEEESGSVYTDGVYTGSGTGFGGEIVVSVTIEEDIITDISLVSASGEDDSYLSAALLIIDNILALQTADVDTITGATFSSTGIRTAVQDALSQAVNSDGE